MSGIRFEDGTAIWIFFISAFILLWLISRKVRFSKTADGGIK